MGKVPAFDTTGLLPQVDPCLPPVCLWRNQRWWTCSVLGPPQVNLFEEQQSAVFGSRDAHRTQGCSIPPPPYHQDDYPEDPWHLRGRRSPPPSYG